jgi:cyanophycinase-like exopeptidase
MKFFRVAWRIPSIFIVMLLTAVVVFAQAPYPPHLIATGGGFTQLQDPVFKALNSRATQFNLSAVQILVMPIGIGSNPNSITDAERKAQLNTADQQRQEIQASCQAFLPQDVACTAVLVPIITRSDANASLALKEFSSNPDAIYFLENNARTILEIIHETDLAGDIVSAYQSGTILSGPGSLFSNTFIQGYRPQFGPASVLTFGAVLAGEASGQGGLGIFPQQALIDTRPFSENRFGRLLISITGSSDPHIGIGIEANTGLELIEDREMQGFYGESVVAILDAETYQSANAVTYQAGTQLVSIRNLLLHLIAPGTTTYDLSQRKNSTGSLDTRFERGFDDLKIPSEAGDLMLTSNLLADASGNQRLVEFTNLSGGQNARLLILPAGYLDHQSAEEEAAEVANRLEVPSETIIFPSGSQEPIQIAPDITGVILMGPDPESINLDHIQGIKSKWLAGMPVLGDRAGAAVLGLQFLTDSEQHGEVPPFSPGRYKAQPGLGFIQANIDPFVLTQDSWERTITSGYLFPQTLAIGIAPGAALKLDSNGVEIVGTNIVTLIDFRQATLTTGTTGIYEIANGMLDVYTPGEQIQALVADAEAAPIHAPTPELEKTIPPPRPTPTALVEVIQADPTEAPREKPPTRTPRPTGTPVPTPPPSDPGTTNLMVFFGVLSVVVVIVGVWLNRQIAA